MEPTGDERRSSVETSTKHLKWGRVSETHERVAIVATGPSVAKTPRNAFTELERLGIYVLGVNGAALWSPTLSGWFTVDPSLKNLKIMRCRRRSTKYFAAVPDDFATMGAKIPAHRIQVISDITYLRRVSKEIQCLNTRTVPITRTLSEDPGKIHTGNSAWGALGLAYLMRAKKIALFGVDGTREPYAYSRERPAFSMEFLNDLFSTSIPQLERNNIEVINACPESTIECFPKVEQSRALQWMIE